MDRSREGPDGRDRHDGPSLRSYLRNPEQIFGFFDGLELVEPGIVPIQAWHPDVMPAEPLTQENTFGGIGLKR